MQHLSLFYTAVSAQQPMQLSEHGSFPGTLNVKDWSNMSKECCRASDLSHSGRRVPRQLAPPRRPCCSRRTEESSMPYQNDWGNLNIISLTCSSSSCHVAHIAHCRTFRCRSHLIHHEADASSDAKKPGQNSACSFSASSARKGPSTAIRRLPFASVSRQDERKSSPACRASPASGHAYTTRSIMKDQ